MQAHEGSTPLTIPQSSSIALNHPLPFQHFVQNGGQVLVLLGEGGEPEFNTNINFFLEEFGININADSVIRPNYYKYLHPKEAIIGGGVASDHLIKILQDADNRTKGITAAGEQDEIDAMLKPQFVYPFGATMNIILPAIPLLTTGPVVYPYNRPLAGLYTNPTSSGRILACGSGHMFQDRYITEEESNMTIFTYFISLLTNQIPLKQIQFNHIDIFDHQIAPDTVYLAEQPKICLVEAIDCDIPADFKKMFDLNLNALTNNQLKDVIGTYEKLNIQYEPLKIIKPQFEIPLPPLQLAIFPPVFSELPIPSLELFDLDESFSTERTKLTQLTSKCLASALKKKKRERVEGGGENNNELKYYVIECGRILGVNQSDDPVQRSTPASANELLYRIALKIANYKKLDRE